MKEQTQVRIAKAINLTAAVAVVLVLLITLAAVVFVLAAGFSAFPWITGAFLLGVPTFIFLAWKIGNLIRWSEDVLHEHKNKEDRKIGF